MALVKRATWRASHPNREVDQVWDLAAVVAVIASEANSFNEPTTLRLAVLAHTDFSAQVCSLPALEQLELNDNNLTDLPAEIGQCQSLTRLSATSNQLTALPDELTSLPALQELVVSRNQIADLPIGIKRMPSLRVLMLFDNRISPSSSTGRQLRRLIEIVEI